MQRSAFCWLLSLQTTRTCLVEAFPCVRVSARATNSFVLTSVFAANVFQNHASLAPGPASAQPREEESEQARSPPVKDRQQPVQSRDRVICLIDGDGCIVSDKFAQTCIDATKLNLTQFHASFLEDKELGGQNAAIALEQGLVRSLSLQSNDELVVVLALNSVGLTSFLAQSKKGMAKFWKGFNSALSERKTPTSFTAVDAGSEDQAADEYLKGSCLGATVLQNLIYLHALRCLSLNANPTAQSLCHGWTS